LGKDSGLGFNVRIYIYKKITKKLKKAIFEFGVGVWVGVSNQLQVLCTAVKN